MSRCNVAAMGRLRPASRTVDLGAQSLVAPGLAISGSTNRDTTLTVEGWLPLQLKATPESTTLRYLDRRACVQPSLCDTEAWRAHAKRGGELRSEAIGGDLPSGIKCVAASPLVLQGQNATELCPTSHWLLSDLLPGATTRILCVANIAPPRSTGADAGFSVGKTPFLTCWWRVISDPGALFLMFVLVGFESARL